MIPFAIIGSDRNVIVDGKPVRARKNRWGVINVEDKTHCEFVYLRNFLTRYAPISTNRLHSIRDMLFRTHLQDLIETTAQIHYEAFRSRQLLALKDVSASRSHQATSSERA